MSTTRKKKWVKSVFDSLPEIQNKEKKLESPAKRRCLDEASCSVNSSKAVCEKKPVPSNKESLSTNWADNFAPITVDDLAVHTKKITELENWFQHCTAVRKKHPAQLCLLTGPSGAAKTAAVRVLAEKNQYELQEWINPTDILVVSDFDENMYVDSQIDVFKNFLLRASRYKSLFSRYDKTLLLVEDFPNFLLNDAGTFESILEDYLSYGKSPLIFIAADSKSRGLNISFNLFPEQTKEKFHINHISFNPIATTLMQKAVKRFCTLMRENYTETYKVPIQIIIDSIIVSAQGDIRNALLNLHFAALKGAPNLLTKPLETDQSKNKKSRKKVSTLKSLGRDESITMLHALGRVFNPKFNDEKRFVHSPEDIAESFTSEPKKFTNFLHANYLAHFSDIEYVADAINGLTIADSLLTEYREDTLALSALTIGIRSLMVANSKPVSAWLPIRGPKRYTTLQTIPDEMQRFGLSQSIPVHLYASEYKPFLKYIKEKNLSNS